MEWNGKGYESLENKAVKLKRWRILILSISNCNRSSISDLALLKYPMIWNRTDVDSTKGSAN